MLAHQSSLGASRLCCTRGRALRCATAKDSRCVSTNLHGLATRDSLTASRTASRLESRLQAVASPKVSESEAEAIPEEELIELTKAWVGTFNGVSEEQAAALSDDFVFRGPVVGPLTKEQYTYALNGFKIHEAFPDVETKAFGFSVDPQDPYRVWFFTQTTGTHTRPLLPDTANIKPTGQPIRNGTEAASVIWTPDRKIKYVSGGYCTDRINSNTPRGTMKVAVVGILRAAGAAAVWAMLTNPIVQFFMNVVNRIKGAPKEARNGAAAWEDLPDWWKELPDARLRDSQRYHA